MDKAEARRLQAERLQALRSLSYDELVEQHLEADPSTQEVTGPSGQTYQVEVIAYWDDKRRRTLRVVVAIDDGGLTAFKPLTDDFIIAPDGRFIGE